MNNRERALAILNYQPYDRLPIVHMGYWRETLEKWAEEGHITRDEANLWDDNKIAFNKIVSTRLGFDFDYHFFVGMNSIIQPPFESKVIEELPDGTRKMINADGAIVLNNPNATGIPAEVDHLLKGRKEWEELYLPRLQCTESRVNGAGVWANDKVIRFDQGGKEFLQNDERDYLLGIHCGSFYGYIRNMMGLVGLSYLYAEDEALYTEMIKTMAELAFQFVKKILEAGCKLDFVHIWEDICFKTGPLINPRVFEEKIGPHYKRLTDLVQSYGINIIAVDCDGLIDSLIPTWFNNGVNTMFPIEVGTWNASIKPWREKHGKELRGIGGMNKTIFAFDYAAVDAEIERLKPLVDLGGFLPCPDHLIPPDAKWENVQYYCEKMRKMFS